MFVWFFEFNFSMLIDTVEFEIGNCLIFITKEL